ncbi:MAG: hypothetical protein JWO43_541 [Candidatus Adlerbacteria bacterium]|nr:hypothetical protein [Candidatus Adlerbacteria bacterium]
MSARTSVMGVLCCLLLALVLVVTTPQVSRADVATSTLQQSIDDTNNKIKQLQNEIAQLQSQLTTTTSQKQTLQSAINALNLNIQKLQKSVSLTQTQINQKDKQIATVSTSIATTTSEISLSREEVAQSLRELDQLDNEPLGIALLTGASLSDFFDQATTLEALRNGIHQTISNLSTLKDSLLTAKQAAEQKRQELASLKQNLSSQQQGLSATKTSQTQLLTQTKNKESEYQKIIAQKKAQEAQFESDLQDFEAQLNLTFNPSSLPSTGSGALLWPLASVRITQYFGNTEFATANSQIYSGHGHNAIDLAASIGTSVLAARGGVVVGTGNTDTTCAGASYGKWVFIKHDNGLSTLYAHLSVIKVAKGDSVAAGGTIGLSGETGYATGPHLHFSVMASAGSEIASFPSKSCIGKTYTMPVADQTAYLNPLSYLPAVPKR